MRLKKPGSLGSRSKKSVRPFFSKQISGHRLARDDRTRILDHHVPLQLDRFVFDCGPKDMALLREPEYYNRHIRLAGLQLAAPLRPKAASNCDL